MEDLKLALRSAAAVSETGSHPVVDLTSFSDFVPATKVDIRYNSAKLRVKQHVLGFLADHLLTQATNGARDLDEFIRKLRDSYQAEQQIVAKDLSLREERDELCGVLRDQRILLALLQRVFQDWITQKTQLDDFAQTADKLSRLHMILMVIEFLEILSDEVVLLNTRFSHVLAQLCASGILLNPLDEMILLLAWAVTPQELRDVALLDS
jgi:hypothetical protein